jgi:hypothetical protein
MEKVDAIITSHVYPPIPVREFDWCAYRSETSDEHGPFGWGATKEEAIADLLEIEEENA